MAQEKVFPMTHEGKQKLEQELEQLKTVKRKEVVERIKIARSFGDLSENSEYDSAKEEQAFVEGRITTLENMIRNAKIIEDDGGSNVVGLGKPYHSSNCRTVKKNLTRLSEALKPIRLKGKFQTTRQSPKACSAEKWTKK